MRDYYKKMKKYRLFIIGLAVLGANNIFAQNPIIRNQFTADPTARVFNGRVYLYTSHDIQAPPSKKLRKDWFCMEDYHVFSSDNLTDWNDHGVIVSQNKVAWVDSTSYSMWAPDCIFKNGKYYFYFPAPARDTVYGRGFSIGVSVSDNPYGPFVSQPKPIKNVKGIDPNVFIDKDGQAYLYWSAYNIYVAKLKDNMTELASEPQVITNLPEKGLKEGPFMFERNGIYYLTFPHVANAIERLEYAMGNSPMGPFKMVGVVMDESPNGCWTNHHSFIELKNQWYLFYHRNDLSPKFDKNRSVRIDSMFFNADGTIRKVIPTLRGVGLTEATSQIQLDRYSSISNTGVTTAFIDTANVFKGWKIILEAKDSWVKYNGVECGKKSFKKVRIRCLSKSGASLLLRLNNANGPVIAKVGIPKGNAWNSVEAPVIGLNHGIQNLVAQLTDGSQVEIDWISFK
jgi:hypothetical protein